MFSVSAEKSGAFIKHFSTKSCVEIFIKKVFCLFILNHTTRQKSKVSLCTNYILKLLVMDTDPIMKDFIIKCSL